MFESKLAQRLLGLFLLVGGGGFTAWSWHTALNEGYYYRKASVLIPMMGVFGLGMLLFPNDKERMQAQFGVDKPEKFAHLPLSWKLVAIVAVIVGLGNWLAISQW